MNALNRRTEEIPTRGNRRLELIRKMETALLSAEENAAAATARRAQNRGMVTDELARKYGNKVTKAMVDQHTDIRCGEDKIYKNFIGQNQWQMQQAIMYGTAVTAYNSLVLTRPFMSPQTLAEMGIDPRTTEEM